MKKYSLRQAMDSDQEFLFHVSNEAMKPVRTALKRPISNDPQKDFAEYKTKFKPEAIQIIQLDGKDVGRLRVGRSKDTIYIGGMQILPEYQGKGIGTEILRDLIQESNGSKIPITLEVHDINQKAKSLYERFGFKVIGQTKEQSVMKYSPIS